MIFFRYLLNVVSKYHIDLSLLLLAKVMINPNAACASRAR